MVWFLGFGIAGLVLLVFSLAFDGLFDGPFETFDGLVSLPALAGFVSMLGFGGAIVLGSTDLGAGAATTAGVAAGAGAAWGTWKASRALMRDQTAATPRGTDLVGTSGAVVTAIPAGGYGEVLLRLGGQPLKLAAKSTTPVERGAEVWVEAALSPTSVEVRRVQP